MPIAGIPQPEIIPIDDTLRLRKFDDEFSFAFKWYQDIETVWLVDGVKVPYTQEKLERMYRYLDKKGELYFIEADGKPIGDVCIWPDDLPIVIGDPAYRGRGIGKKVIRALIDRAESLGWKQLRVNEIYHYNEASRKCFESLGFRETSRTETGSSFILELERTQ